jgi:hypothetical protein
VSRKVCVDLVAAVGEAAKIRQFSGLEVVTICFDLQILREDKDMAVFSP